MFSAVWARTLSHFSVWMHSTSWLLDDLQTTRLLKVGVQQQRHSELKYLRACLSRRVWVGSCPILLRVNKRSCHGFMVLLFTFSEETWMTIRWYSDGRTSKSGLEEGIDLSLVSKSSLLHHNTFYAMAPRARHDTTTTRRGGVITAQPFSRHRTYLCHFI